jgi:hypothetical protein
LRSRVSRWHVRNNKWRLVIVYSKGSCRFHCIKELAYRWFFFS